MRATCAGARGRQRDADAAGLRGREHSESAQAARLRRSLRPGCGARRTRAPYRAHRTRSASAFSPQRPCYAPTVPTEMAASVPRAPGVRTWRSPGTGARSLEPVLLPALDPRCARCAPLLPERGRQPLHPLTQNDLLTVAQRVFRTGTASRIQRAPRVPTSAYGGCMCGCILRAADLSPPKGSLRGHNVAVARARRGSSAARDGYS
jgi:hypothetical protein